MPKKKRLCFFASLPLLALTGCGGSSPEENSAAPNTTSNGTAQVRDIPIPGDYDGDGKMDAAIWKHDTRYWMITLSSTGKPKNVQWGIPLAPENDMAVPGDYDGDGKTDVATWRRQTGVWWIQKSSDGQTTTIQWGLPSDQPAPGDYDGDKKWDAAVWREGVLLVKTSSDGKEIAKQAGVVPKDPKAAQSPPK